MTNQELLGNESEITNSEDTKIETSIEYIKDTVHISGFRGFLLKPEILKAISDCGFEQPSEIQHKCIPEAILGTDILAQAKSGMGKTAVFVLSTLQQLLEVEDKVHILVLCHTRELAFQICKEYKRLGKYLPNLQVCMFIGGFPIKRDQRVFKNKKCPQIVVGTPGRILDLVKLKLLNLENLKHFILDECDKMLGELQMRKDVQAIFHCTPHDKQVMMFSATLSKEMRIDCKKFMTDPVEVYEDNEAKLSIHGLLQHYLIIKENEKNQKLIYLLDVLEFNQVVIFVKSIQLCIALTDLLNKHRFPAIAIHCSMNQNERLERYQKFKKFGSRILVATNLFGGGIDIERVNIVFNYDMPENSNTYLDRVARAGRFGTKGLVISFVVDESDAKVLEGVQGRLQINIASLPDEIDLASYIEGR